MSIFFVNIVIQIDHESKDNIKVMLKTEYINQKESKYSSKHV